MTNLIMQILINLIAVRKYKRGTIVLRDLASTGRNFFLGHPEKCSYSVQCTILRCTVMRAYYRWPLNRTKKNTGPAQPGFRTAAVNFDLTLVNFLQFPSIN